MPFVYLEFFFSKETNGQWFLCNLCCSWYYFLLVYCLSIACHTENIYVYILCMLLSLSLNFFYTCLLEQYEVADLMGSWYIRLHKKWDHSINIQQLMLGTCNLQGASWTCTCPGKNYLKLILWYLSNYEEYVWFLMYKTYM